MPSRERMLLDGELVTVVLIHGNGRNADVTVRDKYGYEKTVKAKQLHRLDDSDRNKRYRFAGPDS